MRPRIAITRGASPVETYRRAIEAAGGEVVEIQAGTPRGQSAAEDPAAALAEVDALLLPGGVDVDPHLYGEGAVHASVRIAAERDALELPLARAALERGTPVLGICRGIQTLNVAAGGTLWQDLPSQRPGPVTHQEPAETRSRTRLLHPVVLAPGSRTAALLGTTTLEVNSLHHQAVRQVAPRLVAVGEAPDGVVEAVEAPGHRFALGVQWHPEELWQADGVQARLFAGLVAAAGRA